MLRKDADYFLELQTQTGWGKTLATFAEWCAPQPGWLTLDVGCGPGLLPALFAQKGCTAVGVDLDAEMFLPARLHHAVAIADVYALPFAAQSFDLITATNLLFLLSDPPPALAEMKRLARPGGKVALLNPSENLNTLAATEFADERGLKGIGRDTFLNWARRAEENYHWTEAETRALFSQAGLKYQESILKIGPGFGRFSWGTC